MKTPRFATRLRAFAARFGRDDEGSIAVETVLILPILFWAYLALFATFHAYRAHSVNQKVAFTLGDMISRETAYLDQDYLNGTRVMLAYLANAKQSDTAIRITSVKWDNNNKIYKRDWSKKKGWVTALNNTAVKKLEDRLPVMKHNERLILVETWVKYDPPFSIGISEHEIVNFVFTRPRYAPKVVWNSG